MARTTLLIHDAVLIEIKRIARSQKRTLTDVVSEALSDYARRQSGRGLPSFTAAGRGNGRAVARESEEILASDIDEREGW